VAEGELTTAVPATPEEPPLHALGAAVAAAAPAGAVEAVEVERGAELVLRVRREALLPVMALLRDDPRFAFEQCVDICGVDWPQRSPRFDVVYNLLSLSLNRRLRVVVGTDEATPVPSVKDLWPSATWYERETWDMFGIVFEGQTDLRRILTDYGFEGHPLRKDFPLTGYVEVRYDEERKQVVYEPVKLTQEFRNFDFLSPWEAMTTLPGDEKVHTNREHLEAQARQRLEGPRP
jgi:NADH-quinone oxidoreductase subunit C